MDRALLLRWLWLVIVLNSIAASGCQAYNTTMDGESGSCRPIEWSEIVVSQTQVFERFEELYHIRASEIELGQPCLRNGEALVVVQGREVLKRHTWMVAIKGTNIDIPPAQ